MTRAHHRSATSYGPDALDWCESAREMEKEYSCSVRLLFGTSDGCPGHLQVRAIRDCNGVKLLLAVESLPFPNTKFQAFWPSAYLLLHRVNRSLANAAYAD